MTDSWKPIATAPRGVSVLLYAGEYCPIYVGRLRRGHYWEPREGELAWRCDASGRFTHPTHWRSIPEPPNDREE